MLFFRSLRNQDNRIKSLYLKGHIDGTPISNMLVDGGAIVNLMTYSLFKKLGKADEKLIRINMTLNGVGEKDPIEAKGVASMELTVGSKTMATTFFVADVRATIV